MLVVLENRIIYFYINFVNLKMIVLKMYFKLYVIYFLLNNNM